MQEEATELPVAGQPDDDGADDFEDDLDDVDPAGPPDPNDPTMERTGVVVDDILDDPDPPAGDDLQVEPA